MPLGIDALYLQSPGTQGTARPTTFFQSLCYSFRRFFHSFVQDYQTEEPNGSERLTLWLSGSFDQVQVVQSLLRESFTAREGIEVRCV